MKSVRDRAIEITVGGIGDAFSRWSDGQATSPSTSDFVLIADEAITSLDVTHRSRFVRFGSIADELEQQFDRGELDDDDDVSIAEFIVDRLLEGEES